MTRWILVTLIVVLLVSHSSLSSNTQYKKCACSFCVRLPLRSAGRSARADWRAVRAVVGRTLVDERSGSEGPQLDVWRVRKRRSGRRCRHRGVVRGAASAVRRALACVAAARRPLRARRAARARAHALLSRNFYLLLLVQTLPLPPLLATNADPVSTSTRTRSHCSTLFTVRYATRTLLVLVQFDLLLLSLLLFDLLRLGIQLSHDTRVLTLKTIDWLLVRFSFLSSASAHASCTRRELFFRAFLNGYN